MPNRIEMEGLDEFTAMLQQLPQHLADEAVAIVDRAAETTAAMLRQAYPRGTGDLRRGVKVVKDRGRAKAGATVRSTSAHAVLWEFGTQNRVTRRGWRRGRAPSHRPEGLVSIAMRNRRTMLDQLIAMVQRGPIEVTNRGL